MESNGTFSAAPVRTAVTWTSFCTRRHRFRTLATRTPTQSDARARLSPRSPGDSVVLARTVQRKLGRGRQSHMDNHRPTAFADRDTTDASPDTAMHGFELRDPDDRELDDRERFDSRVASAARSRMLLEAVGATHPGRRRLNQDQFLIADLSAARRREDVLAAAKPATESLLVVADGLGGHPSGEVASLLAVRTLLREL